MQVGGVGYLPGDKRLNKKLLRMSRKNTGQCIGDILMIFLTHNCMPTPPPLSLRLLRLRGPQRRLRLRYSRNRKSPHEGHLTGQNMQYRSRRSQYINTRTPYTAATQRRRPTTTVPFAVPPCLFLKFRCAHLATKVRRPCHLPQQFRSIRARLPHW